MKKSVLVLLTLVPFIIGDISGSLIMKPNMIKVCLILLPFISTAFWFYLGIQYARSNWKPIKSVLIAHAMVICSVFIYFWQFILVTSEERILVLSRFSQLFTSSTPIVLLSKIAILFESDSAIVGKATFMALQILALIYMIIIFCLGLYLGKRISKEYDF